MKIPKETHNIFIVLDFYIFIFLIFLPKVGAGATVAAHIGALLEFGSNLMKKAFSELSL